MLYDEGNWRQAKHLLLAEAADVNAQAELQ